MPCFFALDHPNYARWLSIHVGDIVALQDNEPSVFEQFENGNFVVNKSGNRFSSIPIHHEDEQNNKCVKGDGGPIKMNKLPLFNFHPTKVASKKQQEMISMTQNCSLFSRLYISCQARDGDLDNFFSYENQSYPPSLSQHGNLRFGSKSDLMDCLENVFQLQRNKKVQM